MSKPLELKDCTSREQFSKLFVRHVEALASRRRKVDVFRDFLAMASYSISNSMMFNADHEAKYMEIAGRYDKEGCDGFAHLLAITVEAMESCRDDFLGHVYMSQEMGISEAGQFFTPTCVADMMGQMTIGQDLKGLIESSGRSYITVNDPACGGGVQLIGAYKSAIAQGVNPSTQLCFYAEDIDTTCVFMTYVQLSLLGLPALVSHRNTISMETWSQWRTPVWWLHGFEYREQRRRRMGEAIEPTSAAPSPVEDAPVVRVNLRRERAVEQVPVACDVGLKQAELFVM